MVFGEMSPAPREPEEVLSVSALTEQIKGLLEGELSTLWVAGEISNFSRPQSGHCYFTLKDNAAQIRAVMWRSAAARVPFELEDGLEVICQGDVEVYSPRGSYQLVVRSILPRGVGALELALRKLREKLAAQGLFDAARKRPLPTFPQRIALVTSPTGAAVRDFLQVLHRRWRGTHVLIVPTRVQGNGSAREIAAGIATANRLRPPVDVLVVGRGGGSLEDLWAFNEEAVVRAIAQSAVPVVSAVGHEIDVTLSDLAADVRALTPSEAAERIVPACEDVLGLIRAHQQRLVGCLQKRMGHARHSLEAMAVRPVLRRPLDRLHDLARRLDERAARHARATHSALQTAHNRLDTLAGKLQSLSPLQVLARGYSLTLRDADGHVVRDAAELSVGEPIRSRLYRGAVVSRVEKIEPETDRR